MKDIYQLREVSDEICKEYGLSIVEKPQGKGQSRSQYYSARSYIREIKKDIDAACIRAFTVKDFVQDMKLEGYSFEEVEGLDCVVHPIMISQYHCCCWDKDILWIVLNRE